MDFPKFFSEAPTVTMREPLAAFLGASKSGTITYGYADAVKLAGHSCPTVAGAYLMVRRGLARLYGDELPERGGIEVHMRDGREQGTTGVVAAVATLLTGAAPESGFGGIGANHRFARRGLLQFDTPIDGLLALRRRDTGRGVVLDLDTTSVPPDPEMMVLFPKVMAGQADEGERTLFGTLWQNRVARMLIERADDPELVHVHDWQEDSVNARQSGWPAGLAPYKRSPEFTETTVPAGLLRHHSTKAGVWGCLHVLQGRLRFHDIPSASDRILEEGSHPVIFPERQHEVAPLGKVRFFIEFWALDHTALGGATGTPVDQLPHA